MGNYLMTSLLRLPHALTPHLPGHPCREDAELMTVKADGQVTQCPILTELDPTLTSGPILRAEPEVTRQLPLKDLHTAAMACATCPLRSVCGGGCRLYSLAYDRGLSGCDEPARAPRLDPIGPDRPAARALAPVPRPDARPCPGRQPR
jgi:radical SAM protein with 4Fe4S-binding SPASM domain